MASSMLAPVFTGWPPDWPKPYYCTPTYPPRPYGWQCVVWAAWRYHQLTGTYVPFGWGNALTWLQGAQAARGWSVSSRPVVPSIICLQPGVDGAYADGHVGIVEQINSDGSVLTSNMNWGVPDGSSSAVEMVTHRPQPGISFLHLTGMGASQQGSVGANANTATMNSIVARLLSDIGVPPPAIAALQAASIDGYNALSALGVILLLGAVAVASAIFVGLEAI